MKNRSDRRQFIDFSQSNRGNFRPCLNAATVSFIALTAAMASAHAKSTIITDDFSAYTNIYGNHGDYLNIRDGSPADNSLTFNTGASVSGASTVSIYGGYSLNSSASQPPPANGNTVTVNAIAAAVDDGFLNIYGGSADDGHTNANTVAIKEGMFNANGNIYGGYSGSVLFSARTMNIKDNAVTLADGEFNGNYVIAGGYGDNLEYSSADTTFNVMRNSVTVAGGSILMDDYGETNIYGGYVKLGGDNSKATVADNTVTITNGSFGPAAISHMKIAGGYSLITGSGASADVKNNTVNITGGEFTGTAEIYGGQEDIGDIGVAGAVKSNKVIVSGGKFSGGYAIIAGGYSDAGVADGNEVILSGGEFSSELNLIVGGLSDMDGNVKNSTVNVYGSVDLANVELMAAADTGANPMKSGGGNTLVFGNDGTPWMSSTGKVSGIYGFDTIRFDTVAWGKPILVATVDTEYAKTGKTTVDASKVAFSGVNDVKKGDKTVLLKAEEVNGDGLELKAAASKYTIGTTLQGNGTVSIENDGKAIAYTIDSATKKAQPQSHTAAMAAAARMTALNQGADTAQAALSDLSGSGKTGLQGFAAMGGGTARQDTGSHVTLKSVNFTAGMGGTADNGAMKLTVGGAVEVGHGSFKNHFYAGEAEPYVSKSGNVNYYGGAVLSEMKWDNRWHMNANLRAGYAKTEQSAALYNAGTNSVYDIDSGAYYVGTEFGGGKVLGLTDSQSIDQYGKYIYLHQGGDSFYAGGYYDVKGLDSHRLRAGARYDYGFNKAWGVYAGLAGEYEFDGKGRVTADGAEVLPAKTKGMRGIGELGVKLTPEKDAAGLALDFNVKGAAGSKYRDVLFGVDVKYMF